MSRGQDSFYIAKSNLVNNFGKVVCVCTLFFFGNYVLIVKLGFKSVYEGK